MNTYYACMIPFDRSSHDGYVVVSVQAIDDIHACELAETARPDCWVDQIYDERTITYSLRFKAIPV